MNVFLLLCSEQKRKAVKNAVFKCFSFLLSFYRFYLAIC